MFPSGPLRCVTSPIQSHGTRWPKNNAGKRKLLSILQGPDFPFCVRDGMHRIPHVPRKVCRCETTEVISQLSKENLLFRQTFHFFHRKMPPKALRFTNAELLNMGHTLAYLEQSLAALLTTALAALGSCRAKYPGLSSWQSALVFVSLFLKANHPNSPDHQVAKYRAQLERFKSHCTTVVKLGAHVRYFAFRNLSSFKLFIILFFFINF